MGSLNRFRTVNFSLMFLSYGMLFLCRKSFSYLLPAVIKEDTFTKSELGAISSSLTLAYCFSKFVGGVLSDRIRPHGFITFALIVVGLLTIQFAHSYSLTAFTVIWFLNGLGQGGGWPPCTKLLKQWYHPSELGTWWSILSASSNLAGALGPLGMSTAAYYLGWRYVMTVTGTLCVTMSPLTFLFVVDSPSDAGLPPIQESAQRTDKGGQGTETVLNKAREKNGGSTNKISGAPANGAKNTADPVDPGRSSVGDVLRSPSLWVISVAFLGIMLQSGAYQEWAQLMLIQDRGFPSAMGSGFTSAYNIGGFIGCISCGYITDKFVANSTKRRLGSPRLDYMIVVSICSFLCQLYFLKLTTPETTRFIIVACAFSIGFCLYSCISLLGLLIVQNSPVHLSGTAHAIGALAGNVGAVSSGFPLSYISSLHDWSVTFTLVLVLTALVIGLMVLCNRMEITIGRRHALKKDS